MKYIVYLYVMIIFVTARFVDRYPDALRCGYNEDKGAMYFAHQLGDSVLMYCQVFSD